MPLYLWQRKDGRSPYWYVRGTVTVWRDGRKCTESIKQESTGTADREEAEAILTQVAGRYQRGNIENREAPPVFSDLVDSYLDAGKSDRYLVPVMRAFGDFEVSQLTQARIDAEGRKAYPNAQPATLRRQWHGVINAVLHHGGIDKRLKLPAKSKSTTRYCTPEQAEAIIRECASSRYGDPWKPALAETLFGTGCRAGEAMDLDARRDVALRYRTITFRDTKNGTERTVPLVARTVAALARLPNIDKAGPLFRRPKGRLYAEKTQIGGHQLRFLRAAAERVGVEFNPHMTRHSFATWFYVQTQDTLRLRRQCGWNTPSLVDRYTHLAPELVGHEAISLGWDFRAIGGLPEHQSISALSAGASK
jgi:integrase